MDNPEPKEGMLLSDEEIQETIGFRVWAIHHGQITKAQHLKTVKACTDGLEQKFEETDDGWFISFKDYEALKKQLEGK